MAYYLLVARDWVIAHPYQTALHAVNGVIFCTPAAATVPFFNTLGFTAAGPAAGRSAAAIMSWFGTVPAGGLYATVQSAAMGGFGASSAAIAAQAGAVASSSIGWLLGRGG
ncbi:hypothetical protein K469DRAFT_656577 [Zopfia rhizophila CBS 207.26]|uniref:Uncharacterized protein n=1 Tax=Zopfia rhizophila CBS 207.26 TaxID=1314779 RepID=A0A6A6ELG2_9PEZI|nr:hypothetical protein K469DRAFT_656577 [Zopfia rhizophila CBS 207.26]